MTKREFVVAYVLAHVTPKTATSEITSIIHNAQFVWAEIEKSADPDEDAVVPRQVGFFPLLFGNK